MKKNLKLAYEIFVMIAGVGLPISQVFILNPDFPPFPDYLIFFATAFISAFVCITIRNTIVSFDIVIYFFLLLTFGGNVAAFIAITTVLVVWTLKSLNHMRAGKTNESLRSIKMGLYNAGLYGLIYILTGVLIIYYPINLRWILAIPTIVVLNELLFSVRTILSEENFWNYIKEEGAMSDLIEMLIYPIGISMALLYIDYGFISTIPVIISIIVLSYIGFQMSRYQEKMKGRIKEEEELNEIARKLEGILDFDLLIQTILRQVHSFINAREVTLILDDREQGINVMRNYDGKKIKNLNIAIPPRSIDSIELPLSTREKIIGHLIVKPSNTFSKENLILLNNLVKHISLCLANAMLYKISIEDSLTSLFTRRYFEQKLTSEISEVKKNNGRLSIVLFDIDDLKAVNDQLGHKMGDQVLKKFAQILKANSRKKDIIARWGGDEFVAIIPDTGEDEARIFGERLKELFSNEVFISENKNMKCSVAFGYLEYHPNSRIPESEIFHQVDKRLLMMKKMYAR